MLVYGRCVDCCSINRKAFRHSVGGQAVATPTAVACRLLQPTLESERPLSLSRCLRCVVLAVLRAGFKITLMIFTAAVARTELQIRNWSSKWAVDWGWKEGGEMERDGRVAAFDQRLVRSLFAMVLTVWILRCRRASHLHNKVGHAHMATVHALTLCFVPRWYLQHLN